MTKTDENLCIRCKQVERLDEQEALGSKLCGECLDESIHGTNPCDISMEEEEQ